MLASANRPGLLKRAVEAGALGYVDKEGAAPERLARGIRRVAEGKRFVDDSLGFGFLQAAEMPLTRRELSVLSLAAEGASIAEIAGSLHLSHGTVRNYMAAITRKTGARNRIDAIRISQGRGLALTAPATDGRPAAHQVAVERRVAQQLLVGAVRRARAVHDQHAVRRGGPS